MTCFGAFWHYFEQLSRLLGEGAHAPVPPSMAMQWWMLRRCMND